MLLCLLPCCSRCFAGAGGPWEFNLRDLLRWCELAESAVPAQQAQELAVEAAIAAEDGGEAGALDGAVQHYASLLFVQRLRTAADRQHAAAAFAEAWGQQTQRWQEQQQRQLQPEHHISPSALRVGWACLPRAASAAAMDGGSGATLQQLALLPSQLPVLESLGGESLRVGMWQWFECCSTADCVCCITCADTAGIPSAPCCRRVRGPRLEVPAGGACCQRQDGGGSHAGLAVWPAPAGAEPDQWHRHK